MATTAATVSQEINNLVRQGDLCYELARSSVGAEQNRLFREAFKYFLAAAGQENVHSLYRIGTLYENGEGINKNLQEALRLYQAAACAGNNDAQNAWERLKKAQQAEAATATVTVTATTATSGTNSNSTLSSTTDNNKDLGAFLHQKACSIFKQLNNKAKMSANDERKATLKQAFAFLEGAAEEEVPEAQYVFGTFLFEGSGGVVQNTKRAIEYFKAAAKHGDKNAEYVLGACSEEALMRVLAKEPKERQEDELAHAKKIRKEVTKALQAEIESVAAQSPIGALLLLSCTTPAANSSSLSSISSNSISSSSVSSIASTVTTSTSASNMSTLLAAATGSHYHKRVRSSATKAPTISEDRQRNEREDGSNKKLKTSPN